MPLKHPSLIPFLLLLAAHGVASEEEGPHHKLQQHLVSDVLHFLPYCRPLAKTLKQQHHVSQLRLQVGAEQALWDTTGPTHEISLYHKWISWDFIPGTKT